MEEKWKKFYRTELANNYDFEPKEDPDCEGEENPQDDAYFPSLIQGGIESFGDCTFCQPPALEKCKTREDVLKAYQTSEEMDKSGDSSPVYCFFTEEISKKSESKGKEPKKITIVCNYVRI